MALSNVRSAQRAFRSSRSIRVWRAASLRRPKAGEDPSRGCGDPGSQGRLAGTGSAPGSKRALVRTEGALRRSRGPGEGSNRRQEPRKSSHARAAETSEWSTPRTDRSADRDGRSGNSQLIKANASLADRFAILISIPGVSNITAFALADRNARARRGGSRTGRKPRRLGPDRPTVRALDRPLTHSRRPRRRPPGPLHASPRRCTIQSGQKANTNTSSRSESLQKSL